MPSPTHLGPTQDDNKPATPAAHDGDHTRQGPVLLSGLKFYTLYACMLLSIFLVALDVTLISTAQTVIVQDLGGADKISWFVTSFLLTQSSFLLFYGQLLSNFPSKPCYLSAVILFELGSLICAVAQNTTTVIIGRAVAGIGASGIMICTLTILAESTTLHQRAALMGGIGIVYGVSLVLGPLIGGAISQHIGWRWNFIINLPAGALAVASIVFCLHSRPPLGQSIHNPPTLLNKIQNLDVIGVIIALGFLIAIDLPLQDGGIIYPWTSARILAPLIASAFIFAILILWCAYRGHERALISLPLLNDRNMIGCMVTSFLCYLVIIINIYYLPRYYQAVFASSPTKSGVDLLPYVAALGGLSFFGGLFASLTGHYYTQMALTPILGIAGSVMLWKIDKDTTRPYLVGAQLLIGFAAGACIQVPTLAVQANIKNQADTSRAVGIVTVIQRLAGTIGNGMASGIFFSLLPKELASQNVPPEYIQRTIYQPDTLTSFPPGPIRQGAIQGYSRAIADVSVIGVPSMAIMLLFILFTIKCTNLKTKQQTHFSDMPAAVRAKLFGRRRANRAAPPVEQGSTEPEDVEKANRKEEEVVEEEVVVAELGVPDVANDQEQADRRAKEHQQQQTSSTSSSPPA